MAHSIVNGIAIVVLGALHLWGELEAHWAAAAILACAGLWLGATRKGPPTAPPGVSGLLITLGAELARQAAELARRGP